MQKCASNVRICAGFIHIVETIHRLGESLWLILFSLIKIKQMRSLNRAYN